MVFRQLGNLPFEVVGRGDGPGKEAFFVGVQYEFAEEAVDRVHDAEHSGPVKDTFTDEGSADEDPGEIHFQGAVGELDDRTEAKRSKTGHKCTQIIAFKAFFRLRH